MGEWLCSREYRESRAEDSGRSLRADAEGAWAEGVASYPHHLWSTSQEALDPGAE